VHHSTGSASLGATPAQRSDALSCTPARAAQPSASDAGLRAVSRNGCKPAELGDHPPPDDGVLGGLGNDFSLRTAPMVRS